MAARTLICAFRRTVLTGVTSCTYLPTPPALRIKNGSFVIVANGCTRTCSQSWKNEAEKEMTWNYQQSLQHDSKRGHLQRILPLRKATVTRAELKGWKYLVE